MTHPLSRTPRKQASRKDSHNAAHRTDATGPQHAAPEPEIDQPLEILGGLSAKDFMRSYWQKKPLLVRQAFKDIRPPVSSAELKRMARRDDVESRLIWREDDQWQMQTGPFARLPMQRESDWTLLVQSIDLHNDAAARLMHRFNFIPAARLDDLMASIATEGGGVGPHFDSYDVFLIQARGRRRWKFGQQKDLSLVPDLPLKILASFQPREDVILEPGDMLYLPPHAAHDGISLSNDCMTLSVGFRAPQASTLAQGMLEAAAEQIAARSGAGSGLYADPPLPGPDFTSHYKDPSQSATAHAGEIPVQLIDATLEAIGKVRFDRKLASRYLGCWLTEPHPLAVFEPPADAESVVQTIFERKGRGHWEVDRRTRMLYESSHFYINGELAPLKAGPRLKSLADARALTILASDRTRMSEDILELLAQWYENG